MTEILARAGFDWLMVDLEHGLTTEADLVGNLHAIGTTRTAALVRPQSAERLRIGRVLDLGAHGVMIPRMDTPAQVREAISFMRYPPDGTRGLALSTRGAGLGERTHADVRSINPQILGIIQIESPSAVEHAAEIAAIDGVDVLFVGPADLSHSLGVPGRFDDAGYLEAITHVAIGRRGRRQGCRDPAVRPGGRRRPIASSASGSSGSGPIRASSPAARGPSSERPTRRADHSVARRAAPVRAPAMRSRRPVRSGR